MLPLAGFLAFFFILWGGLVLAKPLVHGALARTAHLTTKLRAKDYLPVFVLLAAGAGVAIVVGDAFVDLAELVVAKSPQLQTLDQRWHDGAVADRTPAATTFFVTMSTLGGPIVMGAVTVVVVAALFLRKRSRWAVYLLVTGGGGVILNGALKHHFARVRPALAQMLRQTQGYSFPSGHTMGSAVVIGGLTYLSLRILTSWWQKSGAIALGVAFVVSVAASRVYLGAHWLSDVGAGAAGGLLWLAATTIGYETFRRIWLIRDLRARSRAGTAVSAEGDA